MNERAAASHFLTDGIAAHCERYGCGHINDTFLLVSESGRRYILQRINKRVFPDVEALMENIAAVTGFLSGKGGDERGSMKIIKAVGGESFYRDGEGDCWRCYDFIEDSLCLQSPESPEDFFESARAFGGFMQAMSEFPAETLHETIGNFHNTPDRYKKFRSALERDEFRRAERLGAETEFVLERERGAGELQRLRENGELPLRVTHNDTKLNNVMLDAKTRRALCVIDLDTVMPGLSLYDYGDSIRFGAATAAEDEKNTALMTVDERLLGCYTKGFCEAFPGLTPLEKELLLEGARVMTLECGLRFLTDYLEGDVYFSVKREGHNLDRARAQFKLVSEMEKRAAELERVIKSNL